jgi:CubicO group peptidase (beta-lactamase class C family)
MRSHFHLLLLVVASNIHAQPNSPERKIDDYIRAYVTSLNFSGTIYAAKEGKVLYEKSFGKACIEWNVSCTNNTAYHLASVSKPFTAASILLLEQQGKLSIKDPLSKYIPDFRDGHKITIHHLLNHNSGIVNINDLPEYDRLSLVASSPDSIVKEFKNRPLEFEPGSKYSYSNSNYNVLAFIIEKVSGVSYGDFLSKYIFDPLEMKSTAHHSNAQLIIKNLATGYSGLNRNELQRAPYLDWTIKTGNGSLYSTVEDLARFDRALYSEALLNKSSKEKMFTKYLSDVGYGWYLKPHNGHNRIYMTGRSPGFTTYFARYPDEKVCIIVLGNLYIPSTSEIGTTIASILFGESCKPRKLKDETLRAENIREYKGRYQLPEDFFRPGYVMEITEKKGRLSCSFGDLIRDSEDEFILRNFWSTIRFERDDSHKITGLLFDNSRAKKL